MKIDDESLAKAEDRAESLLQFRSEEDQWAVLEDLLVKYEERNRELMLDHLVLERVRDTLYPGLSREQWKKLGWSGAGLVDHTDSAAAAKFIHKVRMAKAAGSTTGRL